MSLPDRNNRYCFDEYLQWRNGVDYYQDDLFFQKIVKHYVGHERASVDAEARKISAKASFRWKEMADRAARPENRPYLQHFDAFNHRIDRIVRPVETEMMEKEVYAEAFFSEKTSPWTRVVKLFLIGQNGEACIVCSLACTEGLVALLRKHSASRELKQILLHCSEGIEGTFGIGAQYLSEIQGGSDVPANLVEAVQEGNTWRLYGKKFFCSATHANYSIVTAKPTGSDKIAIFLVPAWIPGEKQKERRNGHTIDRIKWKMGTSELTTAEITYEGAIAYPVGPLDRGLAHVVGIVLTHSRIAVALSAGAFMTRAVREAKKYSEFRQAFGKNINTFPMVAGQVKTLELFSRRTVAGFFKLYSEVLKSVSDVDKKKEFQIRELILLQKITASWDATDVIRTSMSILGGHGVMEDFTSLPRLFRDSTVNELWEGPRNVLLSQIHRDFKRVADWYSVSEFVHDLFHHQSSVEIEVLSKEMQDLISGPDLNQMSEDIIEKCRQWDKLCHRLFHAYQDLALYEVENT